MPVAHFTLGVGGDYTLDPQLGLVQSRVSAFASRPGSLRYYTVLQDLILFYTVQAGGMQYGSLHTLLASLTE